MELDLEPDGSGGYNALVRGAVLPANAMAAFVPGLIQTLANDSAGHLRYRARPRQERRWPDHARRGHPESGHRVVPESRPHAVRSTRDLVRVRRAPRAMPIGQLRGGAGRHLLRSHARRRRDRRRLRRQLPAVCGRIHLQGGDGLSARRMRRRYMPPAELQRWHAGRPRDRRRLRLELPPVRDRQAMHHGRRLHERHLRRGNDLQLAEVLVREVPVRRASRTPRCTSGARCGSRCSRRAPRRRA